ncbi:MAG: TetR/AcrR family transcriptional regulator [Bacteroidia bacterium]|nr:TetR/AcrR family transcriptional regulator [Bacteroidia bacterium]
MGRKSKAQVRKPEILSHFYQVIIEEGLEGASIAKVAKRMGVNPSLLIHYFTTKEAMVEGLIDYILDTYSSHLLPDFSGAATPRERWDDVVDVLSKLRWVQFMNEVVFYNCYTLSLRDPKISNRFEALYERLIQSIAQETEYAARHGVIEAESPRMFAEQVVALIEGSNFYENLRRDKARPVERSNMIKAVINSLCRVIEPNP